MSASVCGVCRSEQRAYGLTSVFFLWDVTLASLWVMSVDPWRENWHRKWNRLLEVPKCRNFMSCRDLLNSAVLSHAPEARDSPIPSVTTSALCVGSVLSRALFRAAHQFCRQYRP